MQILKLNILNSIRSGLRALGFDSQIEKGSVCVYKLMRQDAHTGRRFAMASAACYFFPEREKAFKVYCSEQYDSENTLRKFSITLITFYGLILKRYDLDTKRGIHVHLFESGRGQDGHAPFSGDINDVIRDMSQFMRA